MRTGTSLGAGILLAAGCMGVAAAQPLKVCMADDNPPLSYRAGGSAKGLDVKLAAAIASKLDRPLEVILFESEFEADKNLAHEVNALLSSGVCELASGYPLLATDLGPPSRPTARVPDHPGAKRRSARPWIPLKTLAASRAYQATAMGLIVRDPSLAGITLDAPGDARIGIVVGTVPGTVVAMFRGGRLRAQTVSLGQGQDALEALEAGQVDASLANLGRYDAWRLKHPSSMLRRTPYTHPLRINIGFVGLAESPELLASADSVIDGALRTGQLQEWAAQEGVSWLEPKEPQISGAIGLVDLLRE